MVVKECSEAGCLRPHKAKGLCNMHYKRVGRHGSTTSKRPNRKAPPARLCSAEGCGNPHDQHGYCQTHAVRSRLYGSPHGRAEKFAPVRERLLRSTERRGDCWEWVGSKNRGYGQLCANGRLRGAHRVSWEIFEGPIPEGMEVDHACHNPSCVAPYHLRLATRKENARNLSGPTAVSTTGIRGVVRHSAGGFVGRYGRTSKHFKDKESAAEWVSSARREAWGEFAGKD